MVDATVLVVADERARGEFVDRFETTYDIRTASTADEVRSVIEGDDVDCLVVGDGAEAAEPMALFALAREERPGAGCVFYGSASPGELGTADHPGVVVEYVDADGPDAGEELERVLRSLTRERSQTAYPVPDAEPTRIRMVTEGDFGAPRLRSALDTVTDLAALRFGTPYASVNLLGTDEQEFLACHGMELGTTPREDSVCTFVVTEPGRVSVVKDLQDDVRFADLAAVQDLDLRMYASATVEPWADVPVGTVCIYDTEPGDLSGPERRYLGLLGDVAGDAIALANPDVDPDDVPTLGGGEAK